MGCLRLRVSPCCEHSCHVDPVCQGIGYALGADPKLHRLSTGMHGRHATIVPGATDSTQTCYNCHPDLREDSACGVSWSSREIGYVDCHGSMAAVANPSRTPWASLPKCQSCHTGNYVSNIRGSHPGKEDLHGQSQRPDLHFRAEQPVRRELRQIVPQQRRPLLHRVEACRGRCLTRSGQPGHSTTISRR